MNKELINKYIAIPLAISVLRLDRDEFKNFKNKNIYLDMVDSAIEKLEKDFYELRRIMHHTHIKRMSALQYLVDGHTIKYTADELKEMTEDVMQEAISSMQLKEFNKGWH